MIIDVLTLAQGSPEALSPTAVGTIIGALIAGLVSAGVIGYKKGEGSVKAHITNDPVMVRMAEEFVTRREFEKLEIAVTVNATKMENLFQQTMAAVQAQNAALTKNIENQNTRLTKKIEEFGTVAFNGRKGLWEQVNEQRDRIAAIEVHADTGSKIEKLADSIHKLAES